MFYKKYMKRFIDVAGAFLLLTITLPVTLTVGLLLAIQNRGGIFFYQERPGFREQPFRIVKFKTMTDEKDEDGNLLPDNDRITALGRWVRKLSVDELPQLINVLKGDMSMIGPRPLLFKYIPLYTDEQKRRHNVRPGITGWAQVNGRNAISWSKKFELDQYYVENVSAALDFKIFWLTIVKIFRREGVNQSEELTMPPFDGTN